MVRYRIIVLPADGKLDKILAQLGVDEAGVPGDCIPGGAVQQFQHSSRDVLQHLQILSALQLPMTDSKIKVLVREELANKN